MNLFGLGEPMLEKDYGYLRHRAKVELDLARKAIHGKVVATHHELAEAYLTKAALLSTMKLERT